MYKSLAKTPRFTLGRIVTTATARVVLSESEVLRALRRHQSGDWGEVDDQGRKSNESSLLRNGRLVSVYRTMGGVHFWIITEWDRSVTTVLLPKEY